MEKQAGPHLLPSSNARHVPPRSSCGCSGALALIGAAACLTLYALGSPSLLLSAPQTFAAPSSACPQVKPWSPSPSSSPAQPILPSPLHLAHLLSGAVQINTSVYDDYPLPVSSSPEVWEQTFAPFQDYLRRSFPLIHAQADAVAKGEGGKVRLDVVNSHGLLYEIKGTDDSLLPVVFMAHQDVVPVDPSSASRWTHPPFSGLVDEKNGLVWGRGASDDKASLITLMVALESLLALKGDEDFKPRRTFLLSFGFDEESSGTQGALQLSKEIEKRYGRFEDGKGLAFVLDEGEELSRGDDFGVPYAAPAVAEKGYVDVRISVRMPGGHSSSPPQHTAIGILSRLLVAIEDRPWKPSLQLLEDGGEDPHDATVLQGLLCLVDAPNMDKGLKGSLNQLLRFREGKTKSARLRLLGRDLTLPSLDGVRAAYASWLLGGPLRMFETTLSSPRQTTLSHLRDKILSSLDAASLENLVTTQAVTLSHAGTKVNALPELAEAVINHRIEADSSVQEVRDRILSIVKPVAAQYGLGVSPWEEGEKSKEGEEWKGTVVLEDAFNSALEPSPRTPTTGGDAKPWQLLSSVIRRTWTVPKEAKDGSGEEGEEPVRVFPSLAGGNTDSGRLKSLSRHIFRFSPSSLLPDPIVGVPGGGIHTVDEHEQIDALVLASRFYADMMRAIQDDVL